MCVVGLAAHSSKAHKEARVVERKVCWASNGEGECLSKGPLPAPDKQSSYRRGARGVGGMQKQHSRP